MHLSGRLFCLSGCMQVRFCLSVCMDVRFCLSVLLLSDFPTGSDRGLQPFSASAFSQAFKRNLKGFKRPSI